MLASPLVSGQTLDRQWYGPQANERLGFSIASAGDVDRDGVNDVIVGGDTGGPNGGGEVFVYSGADGHVLHHWSAQNGADRFGFAVLGPGDLDVDGVPDLVVGATAHGTLGNNNGKVYVYSGATGALLYSIDGRAADCFFGTSLAAMGDLDGDGCADFAAGAHGDPVVAWRSGAVYVYSGKTGTQIAGLSFFGQHYQDEFGSALASADFDGDGALDVIVGIHGCDSPNGTDSGRVEIYSGRTGALLVSANGPNAGDHLANYGTSVSAVADVNGDGIIDFIAGASEHNGTAGSACGLVCIFSGADGTLLRAIEGSAAFDNLGTSVASVSDCIGTTFVAGAPTNGAGAVYGFDCSGMPTFTLNGQSAGDGFGYSVAYDLERGSDLLVGAWRADTNTLIDAGAAYAYSLCSTPASWTNFGSGFPGYSGIPSLTAQSNPVLGTSVALGLTCSAKKPRLSVYYFFAGLTQVDVPTNLGGTFYVGSIFLVIAGTFDAAGQPIPDLGGDIPNDPSLCGLHVYGQTLETDPAAAKGFSFTPGLDLQLGR